MYIRSTWTLFSKEMKRFMDVWTQTIGAPIVSNLLYFVLFGSLVGAQAGSEGSEAYLTILIPGLAAMALMMNAFNNPLGSIMIAKYSNSIRELLTYPMKGWHIALAYLGASLVRGIAVAIVTLLVGSLFTRLPFEAWIWIPVFAVLIAIIFASFGIIVAIMAKTFDQSSMILNFLLMPMIYLGGVFYSIKSLPEAVQIASKFNPIFYMVDGFRYGFLGTGDANIWVSFAVTAVMAALFFATASWIFNTGYKLKT